MKILEPVTVTQARASLRNFSVRSLSYACMILIALVSQDVVAQTIINVTLQPGESTKTIQAPMVTSFTVRYGTAPHYCNWPTTAQLKILLESISPSVLQERLTQTENLGLGGSVQLQAAMSRLMNYQNVSYGGQDQTFTLQQLAAGPLTHTFASRCLSYDEARNAVSQFVRIVRLHLGLPPGNLL